MIVVYVFAQPHPRAKIYYSYSAVIDTQEVITKSYDPEHDIARYIESRPWLFATDGQTTMVEVRDGVTGNARCRFDAKAIAPYCIEERSDGGLTRRLWRPTSLRRSKATNGHAGLGNCRYSPHANQETAAKSVNVGFGADTDVLACQVVSARCQIRIKFCSVPTSPHPKPVHPRD